MKEKDPVSGIGDFEKLLAEITDMTTRLSLHKQNLQDYNFYLFGAVESLAEHDNSVMLMDKQEGFFNLCSNQLRIAQSLMREIEVNTDYVVYSTRKA